MPSPQKPSKRAPSIKPVTKQSFEKAKKAFLEQTKGKSLEQLMQEHEAWLQEPIS